MVKKDLMLKACDFDSLSKITGNIYESVSVVSKQSRSLTTNARMALFAEFADLNIKEGADNNFVDSNIKELVSKRYEMARKPLLSALDDFLTNQLEVTYDDEVE